MEVETETEGKMEAKREVEVKADAEDEASKRRKIDADAVVAGWKWRTAEDEDEDDLDDKDMEAMEEPSEEELNRRMEEYEKWKKRNEEEERAQDPEKWTDRYAYEARMFRKNWTEISEFMGYGGFEDETNIPRKLFTYNPAPRGGLQRDNLQVFSVKVEDLSEGLQWPLDVFGIVALRDQLDHNRNIIFKRERENCQTLTDETPYLVLTGPTRAVALLDRVVIEVSLYVKGTTKSDDKELSLLATSFVKLTFPLASYLDVRSYASRLSTLKFTLGHIIYSVEATISVKVISGAWPDDFYGQFAASTDSIKEEAMLLDSGDEKVPLSGDEIKLSRCVLSVEGFANLKVRCRASDGETTFSDEKVFKPLKMHTSSEQFQLDGFCELEVTVAWSLSN